MVLIKRERWLNDVSYVDGLMSLILHWTWSSNYDWYLHICMKHKIANIGHINIKRHDLCELSSTHWKRLAYTSTYTSSRENSYDFNHSITRLLCYWIDKEMHILWPKTKAALSTKCLQHHEYHLIVLGDVHIFFFLLLVLCKWSL